MKMLSDLNKEQLLKLIQQLQQENERLKTQAIYDSWKTNPDRSGGAFTDEEIRNATEWR